MSANKDVLRSVFRPGFGCRCGKMKPPDVIQPQPIHPQVPPPNTGKSNSTSSASTEDTTSATFSRYIATSPPCSDSEHDPTATEVEVTPRSESLSSSAVYGSIAVAKESNDPYQDFQDSMLLMLLERGIYSRDGLEDLLRCFLELNSPCYHEVIIRAFSEIWHGFVSDHHRKTHHPKINGLGSSWR